MDLNQKIRYKTHDWNLARFTGLYKILGPSASNNKNNIYRGRNPYHVLITIFVALEMTLASTVTIGLFYMVNNMNDDLAIAYNAGILTNIIFSSYKIVFIAYNAKDIRLLLDITVEDFMSYRNYDENVFTKWKKRTNRVITALVLLWIVPFFIWYLSPYVFKNFTVNLRRLDGSYSKYKSNTLNAYIMISDDTYNAYFTVFYFVETLCLLAFNYFMVVYDVLIILICFSFSCKFEAISDGILSLGHNSFKNINNHHTSSNIDLKNVKELEENRNISYNLKIIITDHQYVMKKLNDYYNIFRTIQLIQIIVVSTCYILVWFIAAISISDNEKEGDFISSIKVFTVIRIPLELYMLCSVHGIINDKKDSIIFALYSCNWTDMDLNSKKLILLMMKMNNANNLKLKYTNRNSINLELFTGTIRVSYSVLSMLIKYNRNKTN